MKRTEKYIQTKIILAITILFSGAITSCTDGFEELNENPVAPVEVPLEKVIIPAEHLLSAQYTMQSFDITNKFMQYTEFPEKMWDFYLNERRAEDDWWHTNYGVIRDLNYILDTSKEGYENYIGVALVIKTWMFYVTTNLYGDIPFLEAGKGLAATYKPKYDSQSKIYEQMLSDLEKANTILGTGSISLQGDVIFNNDILRWRKFANSLKIRLLVSQSKKVNPSVGLKKILASPSQFPIMQNNDDQVAFSYVGEGDYVFPRGKQRMYAESTFMTEIFINKLLEFNDERIRCYADTVWSESKHGYVGIPSGSSAVVNENESSRVSPLIMESKGHASLQTVWMSYAELQFLLAEAAEKGWISGGTDMAEKYYEEGIEASYEYNKSLVSKGVETGLPLMEMDDWDGSYLSHTGVEYKGSTSEKLDKIALQKWIALYNEMESYFSWRRTGIPVLVSGPQAPEGGAIPLRFKYPLDEVVYNEANYDAAVSQQGADKRSTKMWILK